MTVKDNTAEKKSPTRYRAPALEKGLEILELLVSQTKPITLSVISERLGRSRNEIFRMVQELESKGYISRNAETDGYSITTKLFTLGLEHPPNQTLLEVALPHMREYAALTEQSCHLAVPVDNKIIVICRIQSPGPVSFSVRVGHQQSLSSSTSGMVFLAWQTDAFRKRWIDHFIHANEIEDEAKFFRQIEKHKKKGIVKRESRFIKGVTDLAAPIMRDGLAVASLTSPCITRLDHGKGSELPIEHLKNTALEISSQLPPI